MRVARLASCVLWYYLSTLAIYIFIKRSLPSYETRRLTLIDVGRVVSMYHAAPFNTVATTRVTHFEKCRRKSEPNETKPPLSNYPHPML